MTEKEFKRKVKEFFKREIEVQVSEKAIFSREREEDDYKTYYGKENPKVLKPPYPFDFLYNLYEESDMLQLLVGIKVANVVGMGWTLGYDGDDNEDKSQQAKDEEAFLRDWFTWTNDQDSWLDISTACWQDDEVLGNLAIEIVRNLKGEIATAYYLPFKHLRLCPITPEDYHTFNVDLPRGKDTKPVEITRPFRRFARLIENGRKKKLRYFKSFGDPRPLTTKGEYKYDAKRNASEILWLKRGFGGTAYGLPQWIGSTFDVSGRRNAQAINWDLLRSQGVPPLIISVEGELTDDSWDEIWNMVLGARGVENFNKIWVLQVKPVTTGVNTKSPTKVQFHNMFASRGDDQMFDKYLEGTQNRLSQVFRIPAGFRGDVGSYSYASLYGSKVIGEEQAFGPERIKWDGAINRKLVKGEKGFKAKWWTYKTKMAEISGPEEIRKAIEALSNAGSLSINNAIRLANDAFGRNFSTYQGKWADYPLKLILPILNRQNIPGMEDLGSDMPADESLLKTVEDPLDLIKAANDLRELYKMFSGPHDHETTSLL